MKQEDISVTLDTLSLERKSKVKVLMAIGNYKHIYKNTQMEKKKVYRKLKVER